MTRPRSKARLCIELCIALAATSIVLARLTSVSQALPLLILNAIIIATALIETHITKENQK